MSHAAPRFPRRRATCAAWCLVVLALAAPCALSATGGPDLYGYTWRDSAEPGLVYAWEDISVTGTDITMAADDANTGLDPLSFTFPYRGVGYTLLAACTNGWASLVDGGSGAYQNDVLPQAVEPRGALAAFWDDYNFEDSGKMYFQDFGDRAVVTWADAPDFDDPTLKATFQIILFADGRILVQIASTTGPLDSATIGIESVDDTDGLTVWSNEPIPPLPYAVEFNPPAPIPLLLDCAAAVPLACGDVLEADLATGVANQGQYRCTRDDLSGREHVYLVNLATPTTVRWVFEALDGEPRLLILPACDANACSVPTMFPLTWTGATGSWYFVVDSPPGREGRYRLRAECLPLDTNLDCAAAPFMGCGDLVRGDLAAGTQVQDSYWCSLADYSGREQVFVVDFPVRVTNVTFALNALTGNPDLIALYPCDANACLGPPGDAVFIGDAVGTYYVVVDCAPGDEGLYELAIVGGSPPTRNVGGALRATGHGVDTVDFAWPGAPLPRPGETYAVLRSDDDPLGPFVPQAWPTSQQWTDPAAPARFAPTHVWYYTVHVADACGNYSLD